MSTQTTGEAREHTDTQFMFAGFGLNSVEMPLQKTFAKSTLA